MTRSASASPPRATPTSPRRRCASASDDDLDACPKRHGERIVGSGERDKIETTKGSDAIRGRGGDDRIDIRKGGSDKVDCGPGGGQGADQAQRRRRGQDRPRLREDHRADEPRRFPGLAIAALLAVAAPGCGLGPGDSSEGDATLDVTRDYGAEQMVAATESDPAASETVIRLLDREAEIEHPLTAAASCSRSTGWRGRSATGAPATGSSSSTGSSPRAGRRRSRSGAATGSGGTTATGPTRCERPAVVGAWPEPFAQASAGGERLPVRIECFGRREPCEAVSERLAEEGVDASVEDETAASRSDDARFRPAAAGRPVGRRCARTPSRPQLDDGPADQRCLRPLRDSPGRARARGARPASRAGRGVRLRRGARRRRCAAVSARRPGSSPAPTRQGVERAVTMLDAGHLVHRYAVLGAGETELALPAQDAVIALADRLLAAAAARSARRRHRRDAPISARSRWSRSSSRTRWSSPAPGPAWRSRASPRAPGARCSPRRGGRRPSAW